MRQDWPTPTSGTAASPSSRGIVGVHDLEESEPDAREKRRRELGATNSRAARFCIAAGIRQFLDLGSGIPTVGNVHEVARAAAPDARVVYADIDPVAVAYSRTILGDDPRTTVVQADLRRPELLLVRPEVRDLLDFDKPIAVMMVAVLHFAPDADDPGDHRRLPGRDGARPFLVISHASHEGQRQRADEHQELYRRTATPMTMRSRTEVRALFDGFDVVDPRVAAGRQR